MVEEEVLQSLRFSDEMTNESASRNMVKKGEQKLLYSFVSNKELTSECASGNAIVSSICSRGSCMLEIDNIGWQCFTRTV
jgi:hypothetical protein